VSEEKTIRRALEIGCVVHVCSALPGEMCKPNLDNHGPPSDMDPEKGPWYGVHHRRWLTWLRESKGKNILTAAEQVYGCDVCDAPINVPCFHMRGPGLGKGEPKDANATYPNAPMKVEGRIFAKDGYQTVQMTVTDPEVIQRLQEGQADVSLGYHEGKPYIAERKRSDSGVITSAPRQSRTAGFDQLYGKPPADQAFVKTEDGAVFKLEKFTTPSREDWVRRQVGFALDEILAVPTTEPELLRRLVSKVQNLMSSPPAWVSGGAETLHYLETVEQETERFMEMLKQRDPKNPLLRHLRSVPMPDTDEIDTVVARPSSEEVTKPITVPDPPKKISSSLEWFKEQAKRALAVNPNITMMEFIDRVGEPEYETAAQRAFHLEEHELEQAVLNVGCDLRCGACAETFFTGSTDLVHRCAMLAKLKCFRCGKPAVAKSQMCEEHERAEGEEIEGHIQANRELNGSSAETRKFAIARMNELDRHPSLYGHTLEGLCGVLAVLLQISGVKPEQMNSFQQFFYATAQAANARTPGPDNDPYGEVIAHARGIVLGIQLLREGPQDAPSPLKLMLPKSPKPEA
jgi:hypothetical protein